MKHVYDVVTATSDGKKFIIEDGDLVGVADPAHIFMANKIAELKSEIEGIYEDQAGADI